MRSTFHGAPYYAFLFGLLLVLSPLYIQICSKTPSNVMFPTLLFSWEGVVFLSPVPQAIGPTVLGSSYCLFSVTLGSLCKRSPFAVCECWGHAVTWWHVILSPREHETFIQTKSNPIMQLRSLVRTHSGVFVNHLCLDWTSTSEFVCEFKMIVTWRATACYSYVFGF